MGSTWRFQNARKKSPGRLSNTANPLRSYDMKAHIQEAFQERRAAGINVQANGVSGAHGALGAHGVNGVTNGVKS